MTNRFISIEYDETSGDPEYKGIIVSDLRKTVTTIMTGDVVADFATMKEWCRSNPVAGRYMYSSSVDHFVFDAPGYGWSTHEDGSDQLVRVPAEQTPSATTTVA
ncbi:hypothetical protein HFN89_06090 [Rhizobium laguerreae]|nr:hypothetical protein [Rhizobium laguerreae]